MGLRHSLAHKPKPAEPSPTFNVDVKIIANFLEAICRDALPPFYEWSCWTKEELEDYRDLSRRRRQFNREKKKGLRDKDEEFCEDDYEIDLTDKFDRIEEHKEDAPLTAAQKQDVFVAFKMYIAKKKINLGPETGLMLALSTVLLAKLSPIAKEKLKDLVKAFEESEQ